jgi:mono/diheme cytochrome c family protein
MCRPMLALLGIAGSLGCHDSASQSAATTDDAVEVLTATSLCDPTAPPPPATSRAAGVRAIRAWLDGAEIGVPATGPRPPVDAALRARGAALYANHCATCHGDKGDGKGPRAHQLTDAPRDHSAGVYELRSTPSGSLPTDDDLFHTISHGVHGTAMPPWLLLSEADRWALVAHLKTLSPAFADDEAPPPLEIPPPPPVTPSLLAHGNQVFRSAGCSSCHGDTGKGNGPASGALHMMNGDPARPRDLTGIHFHRGSDTIDIYRSLLTGLDGSPMASFARVMSTEDMWAVASYVHSLVPPYVPGPAGMRCPSKPSRDPQELIGVRSELRSLAR